MDPYGRNLHLSGKEGWGRGYKVLQEEKRSMRGKRALAVCLAGMLAVLASGCSKRMPWVSAAGERSEEVQDMAANRLDAVKQYGKLKIGISADYAPFAFENPDGEGVPYAGADIELGNYIAENLGVEAEFCEMEFDDCLAAVAEGSVDLVLLGMLPKGDRDTVMDYTEVYYRPGRQVFLIKESQKEKLSKLEDFEEKTVAAQYGSLQAQLLVEQLPGSLPELTENVKEGILKLRLGIVDGVILEEALAETAVLEHEELALSQAELSYTPSGVVGGVVKGETELLAAVNKILGQAAEENLYLKWLDAANEQAMSLSRPIR